MSVIWKSAVAGTGREMRISPLLSKRLYATLRAAAVETPDEALTLVHSTYPLMFPIGVNEPTRREMSMRWSMSTAAARSL